MGVLSLLFALQLAATALGGLFLWRRQRALGAQIEDLRAQLAAASEVRSGQRAARQAQQGGVVSLVAPAPLPRTQLQTAARADAPAPSWLERVRSSAPLQRHLSVKDGRTLALAGLALAPVLGFALALPASLICVAGIVAGAAMLCGSLHRDWRAAAWAGVLTSSAWALLGFSLNAAHATSSLHALAVGVAGGVGLTHTFLRRSPPGMAMALAMSAAVLALASQVGATGPNGLAYGALIAATAIVGASNLRLEGMHLAAFGASLIGLFVLSGQDAAALWFTPAAVWTGALFFAIAVVRVPQLGADGAAIAGTGTLAPLAATSALYFSHHGLDNRFAAACAFAVLALLFGALIAACAKRRANGLAELRLTLWILALSAFAAFASAVSLALPAPLATPAFAACALGLGALNTKAPSHAWLALAILAGAFGLAGVALSAYAVLTETGAWPVAIAVGAAAPAALMGTSAYFANRAKAGVTSGVLETLAFLSAVTAGNLLVRILYSAGAPMLQPVSFAELGAHIGVWLLAAFAIRYRARLGAREARLAAASTLTYAALAAAAVASGLWLTSFWAERQANLPLLSRDTLGFLIPAILFLAHWLLWRRRAVNFTARATFAAGALMLAAFAAIEFARIEGGGIMTAAMTALVFAIAGGANFATGIVIPDSARLRERSPSKAGRPAER